MNRVGSALSKSVFLPRLFCHRFFASGPTDARQNVLVVIVDFNGEQQMHVNGRYSELLGRSPDFPFPGNVKPSAEVQKVPHPLEILPTQQQNESSAAFMPLHKIVEPAFVVSDDRIATPRALKNRQMWQMGERAASTIAKWEWKVSGVVGIRMLCEEVNAMFGKRFLTGTEITVISLRANVSGGQRTMTETTDETDEEKTATEVADDQKGASRLARSDLLIPSYEFVRVANALCMELRGAKFWADFVDPRNGRPYRQRKFRRPAEPSLGQQSLMLEWDPQNTFNGLRISGGGTTEIGIDADAASATTTTTAEEQTAPQCKVIERADWTTMDFCGQLFTDCPPNSKELQQILASFETATKAINIDSRIEEDENGGNTGGRGAADLCE